MTLVHRVLRTTPIASFAEYASTGGGTGQRAATALGPDGVLDEIEAAGLRGRGGAGFPTARKWRTVRREAQSAHHRGRCRRRMFSSSTNQHFDNTDEYASKTLSRKTIAADSLIACVRLAIELAGGIGYTRATELERLDRDVHVCLFASTSETNKLHRTGRARRMPDYVNSVDQNCITR